MASSTYEIRSWIIECILFGSYHIAGTKGVFYAREPYANVDAVHVTRFLGLAPVGNKDKQVFLLLDFLFCGSLHLSNHLL